MKQYLNAFINNSAVIHDVTASDITNAAHKAVVYDGNGKLTLPAADGAAAVGVILSDVPVDESAVTKAGTEIDVLIQQIGLIEAGEAVNKGDLLTVSSSGTAKKAASGNFILGAALTAAAAAGELVQIQITKSGYAAAVSSTPQTPKA